jgi:hypothetical protein
MNVSRGLFRAWILVAVLWAAGAGSIAFITLSPGKVSGAFQPSGSIKDGLKPWEVDYNKPFYDVMRSPAAEKLSVEFFPVAPKDRADWDKDNTMVVVEMPDDTRFTVEQIEPVDSVTYERRIILNPSFRPGTAS